MSEVEQALAQHWDREPACDRCWLEQRPTWDVPIKWTYTEAEREALGRLGVALPRATHAYNPPCKCGGGCGDELLCAAHAERVVQPRHVRPLADDPARDGPGEGEEG